MDTRQKKHVLTGCCQTFKVWQPLKQTVTPKASCLYVFDQCILLIFHFSQLPGTFLAQKKHTCFWKLFLMSKHSCKEYFVERKQMNSTTTACSKLWMLGSKTCHVCTLLELQLFLTCSGLDAINGMFENFEQRPSSVRILHHHYCIRGSQEQECMNSLLALRIGMMIISSFNFQLNLV